MITQEIARIGEQLDQVGHVQTSFEALGLEYPDALARELDESFKVTEQYAGVQAEGRTGMLMYRDDAPLQVGRRIVTPVIETLFADRPNVTSELGMYAVNHYNEGDFFNPHQDHFDGTVMIATTAGARNFDVYNKEPEDDVFRSIAASYRLGIGSIVLLNGYKNLGHAAQCLEGPSISVVSDVPYPMTAHQDRK